MDFAVSRWALGAGSFPVEACAPFRIGFIPTGDFLPWTIRVAAHQPRLNRHHYHVPEQSSRAASPR